MHVCEYVPDCSFCCIIHSGTLPLWVLDVHQEQTTISDTRSFGCCLQASAAVRDFETKDDIRVFLLPHKVGAAGLTLNRGDYPRLLLSTCCVLTYFLHHTYSCHAH